MPDNCVSLSGSKLCSAFSKASVSTSGDTPSKFSFLQGVKNVDDFDTNLKDYVNGDYLKDKYSAELGCSNAGSSNSSDLYARYTTSVICNKVVRSSMEACKVSDSDASPLCAESCAAFAESEEEIVANKNICGNPKSDYLSQIRADFTQCSLPGRSLGAGCISAAKNEPDECGFGDNLLGLCTYCSHNSPNATDSCCAASKTEDRCTGTTLPTVSLPPLFPANSSHKRSLSDGAITGIVIGCVSGLALLILALAFLCLRKKRKNLAYLLNRPSPHRIPDERSGTATSQQKQMDLSVLPTGARVARLDAMRSDAEIKTPRMSINTFPGDPEHSNVPSPKEATSTVVSPKRAQPVTPGPPTVYSRRQSSRSPSNSSAMHPSPGKSSNGPAESTAGSLNVPGAGVPVSAQLSSFDDYYSEYKIYPSSLVSVLWPYQPRAPDEFNLERGQMLRVMGIWDDGWATGINLRGRHADDIKHGQRDSGVQEDDEGVLERHGKNQEVKAFPLVCVCAPAAWHEAVKFTEGYPGL